MDEPGTAARAAPGVERRRSRRPAWIPHVATIVVVVVCVAAGNWQRSRMHEKDTLRAALEAADAAPAVGVPGSDADWNAWRYRRVVARGRYDAARQFLLDNRVHEGRVGYEVVTPLMLADGRWLLVDRGFVPAGRERSDLPQRPPPTGDVSVEGRIQLVPRGYFMSGGEASGVLWPHLDPALFAQRTGRTVLPVYLQASGGDAGDGLSRDWPAPDLGSEKHLGYMVQWYSFAALAAGLWAYFTFRRRARVH
jgi:surfeit locus 1 family protein